MRREVFDRYDRPMLTVGETPGATVGDARRFTDPASRELDMIFQFEHVGVDHGWSKWDRRPLDWRRLKGSLDRWQLGLAEVGWNSLYWDNHDQPRAVSRFGDDSDEFRVRSAKALATVLHLQRGTPFVYQGEELGMTNVGFASIEDYRDIETLRYFASAVRAGVDPDVVLETVRTASRDNARTPMQWTAGRHAGFTTGTPWLAVNPNHATINAATEIADEWSVFHHYRRLIDLRRTELIVSMGDYEPVLPGHPVIYAFRRRLADDELLVVANCSSAAVDAEIAPRPADARVVITNYADAPGWDGCTIALRPWEAAAYRSGRPVET
jgi:oligo-1,6-glucosidase